MILEFIMVGAAILIVWTVLHSVSVKRRAARSAKIRLDRDTSEAYSADRRRAAEDTVIRAERQRDARKRAVEEPFRKAERQKVVEGNSKIKEARERAARDSEEWQRTRRSLDDISSISVGSAASSFGTSSASVSRADDNSWSPGGGSSGGGGATVSFGDTSAPTSTPDAPSTPSGD